LNLSKKKLLNQIKIYIKKIKEKHDFYFLWFFIHDGLPASGLSRNMVPFILAKYVSFYLYCGSGSKKMNKILERDKCEGRTKP